MKKIIKSILPPVAFLWIKSFFSQWSGKYSSWVLAQKDCEGYDSSEIFSKVFESAKSVSTGECVYERDSVLFDEVSYSWPFVTAIQQIYLKHQSLNILDFGGGLGSSYYQNKYFLNQMDNVSWTVVEQEHFVKKGQEEFQNERLKFLPSIEDVFSKDKRVDIVLISSTLQYLEEPYKLLQQIIDYGPEVIFLDRLSLIDRNEDWITKQTVPPSIYSASYPCRFFSRNNISRVMLKKYSLLNESECYVKNEGFLSGFTRYKDVSQWYIKKEL